MLTVEALDHFVLRVRDLERSLAFYRDLLGLKIEFLDEYRAGERFFVSARIGQQLIDLLPDPNYDPEAVGDKGGFNHFCVGVRDCDFDRLIPWLQEMGVRLLEEKPASRMGAKGMGLSIYVTDPDGYIVELKQA
jgi:catechol 2,3-dioxygenase-like lactoylglutathione lyase family enzyme